MMKTMTKVAALTLLVVGGSAFAQQAPAGLYGELGYTGLKVESGGASVKPGAVRGILGYAFHPNVAVEGMVAIGANDDTTQGVTLELKRAYGVYLKPKFNPTKEFEVFARLGYVDSKFKASAGGASASDSDGDVSYGVGASYKVNQNLSVGLDYLSYYNKDGDKIKGWTLGLGYAF